MNTEKAIYKAQKYLVSTYSKLLINMDIEFEAPLPSGPKIIAANHPTTTDPFLLSLISDEPIFIPVTKMAFKMPIFGNFLRSAGHIEVDKTCSNGQFVIDQAIEKITEGKTIGIFPEGALCPEIGTFCRTKTGAARMALLSGAPIIPVGIYLEKDTYFVKEITVQNHSETARIVYRGNYAMTVGKALHYFGGIDDYRYVRNVAEDIMGSIVQQAKKSEHRILLNQSSNQVYSFGRL